MNEDIFKGKWKELKGSVKEKWGDLTDDEVTVVEGKTEKLVGILQAKYGYSKDKAQDEYNKFMDDNKQVRQ
jgi:uncharacterized protein YjbJ (UPF0337 family)